MVQTSTLLLAAFAIAPVLAAPIVSVQTAAGAGSVISRRSFDVDTLDARSPFFKSKWFRRVKNIGASLLPHAAKLFFREEDGSLSSRDVELSARDFQEITDLQSRGELDTVLPSQLLRRYVDSEADLVGGVLLRDLEGDADLAARSEYDPDLAELSERDLEELYDLVTRDLDLDIEDLDAREPWRIPRRADIRRLTRGAGRVLRTASGVVNRVSNVAGALGLRDFEDDIEELSTREVEDLDAREPWRIPRRADIRRLTNGAGRVLRTASGVVNRVSNVASALGLREFEDALDTRHNIDELD